MYEFFFLVRVSMCVYRIDVCMCICSGCVVGSLAFAGVQIEAFSHEIAMV